MEKFVFLAFWGVGATAIGYVFFRHPKWVSARARRDPRDVLNTPRGIKIGGAVFMAAGPVAIVVAVINLVSG